MPIDRLLDDDRRFRRAAWLFLVVSLAVRLALAVAYPGFLTGDDVEILETGLRGVLHLDYVPWEIRNTLLPTLLVAPMGWLATSLGFSSPLNLAVLATVPFALLSTLNLVLVYRVTLRFGGGRTAATLAAILLGTHWIAVGYGSTVYPRTAAATCILLALFWTAGDRTANSPLLGAGALAALAFAFRYSELVFLPPLLLFVAAEGVLSRRLRRLAIFAAGFGAGALLFVGLWDRWEWGAPFASLRAFFDYTLIERKASTLVEHQPFYWYLWRAPHWLAPAALLGVWQALRRSRSSRSVALFVALPLLGLSAIHHKELRYLQALLPFVCVLGGLGLAAVWRAGWRRVVVALLVITAGWSGIHARFLEKKSMAAVEAAQYLVAAKAGLRQVALQQPWAFGDRLLLSAPVGVKELPMDLRAQDIGRATVDMDAVALYSDLVTAGIAEALGRSGFCLERRFAWGRSREVSIYSACTSAGVTRPAPPALNSRYGQVSKASIDRIGANG